MPIYDGIETCIGMSGANPTAVPRNMWSRSVNRIGRYDTNDTRFPFREIDLTFETEQDRILFAGGNAQGGYFYNSYPTFLGTFLIISVAGTIYKIKIVGKNGEVTKLFEGNDPVLQHAWFGQAFEWLIIQDGLARPILWDGTNPARRAIAGEVPTGSVMGTIHGRLAVASSDGTNQIAVGDIVYGSDVTTTSDVIRFTETQYWSEGGAFGAPVYVGDIMGLYPMPYLDTGDGQNELVIPGTEGIVSLDLSGPRESWIAQNPLRISLPKGAGCSSSHSLSGMNGDLLYRGYDGVRSFKNARIEFQSSWKQTPISTDVRRWLSKDPDWLLQFCSMVSWKNLLFVATQPMVRQANNKYAGHHYWHRGFVVMDSQPESNTLRDGASVWHGLWTGIRPVFFMEGRVEQRHRCFALSYDCDGRNRLYEIEQEGVDDILDGHPKKIVSYFDTPLLGTVGNLANNFSLKKLSGGSMDLSNLKEKVAVAIQYRPDNSPCNLDLHSFEAGCDCATGDCNQMFTQPRPHKEHFEAAKESECLPGSDGSPAFQFNTVMRVKMEGRAVVERLRIAYEPQKDDESVRCGQNNCEPIQCCDNADFTYNIATCGENTEVPFIPTPRDVVETFTSERTYIATCPNGQRGQSVTVTAQATSTISQQDANNKAVAAARAQAEAQLVCLPCDPIVLFAFTSNNQTTDLSAYFASGIFNSNDYFRPWQLIETVTEIVYASGYVGNDGTLVIVYVLETYATYFDPVSKEFVDGATSDGFFSLDLGCSVNGETIWPENEAYVSP